MGLVKYYTLCGACFAEPDMFSMFEDYFEIFGGGTRLAIPKTIFVPDTSTLMPSLGATEGVLDYWDLGRPGYVTWAGLMSHEDTRTFPCPYETLLCVDGKLGVWSCIFLLL
mgnify:CR=1 FL=1